MAAGPNDPSTTSMPQDVAFGRNCALCWSPAGKKFEKRKFCSFKLFRKDFRMPLKSDTRICRRRDRYRAAVVIDLLCHFTSSTRPTTQTKEVAPANATADNIAKAQ
jgi:hypothetical protein